MTESRNASITSIDQLMGATLDDLDDLPSFETPPPGTYILACSTEVKEVNKQQAIEARFTIQEVVELKDPTAKPPVTGSQFSILFMMNEIGIGKLKEFAAPFAAHFNTRSVGELVRDHIKGVTISAAVGNRADKDDKEKMYATVKVLSIA